jgi:uncharacterized iron-regulated protein
MRLICRRGRVALWLACLLLASLNGAACARTMRIAPQGGFEAAHGSANPLVGKIWSRADAAPIERSVLLARVEQAPVLLIGETHDHVDHHRLQALLLEAWLRQQPRAAVAFEMLDEDQAPALQPAPTSADELASRVGWQESGWPDFALYRPVFEAALRGRASILAAHPSREQVRASMSGVSPEQRGALLLDPPLGPAELSSLAQEIRDSHCGHAPEPMVQAMVQAQSFKDAWMARALADAGRPVALIAGKGHIDEGHGVPVFLARRGLREVLTIALVEVSDERDPTRYPSHGADLVVFTPRVTDEDPCRTFEAQLEQMRAHPAKPTGP